MTKQITITLALATLFLLSSQALVRQPAAAMVSPAAVCRAEPRTDRAYQAGVRGGANVVKQAWAAVNDCSRLAEVRRVVDDNLSRLTAHKSSSLYVKCRYWGMTDGVEEEFARIENRCR